MNPPPTEFDTPSQRLRMTVYTSLLAALTAAGAFIAVPIGPVPIVLQNLFAFLMALLLGPRWALGGMAVYLVAGACGLPVFAGGLGGLGRLAGPTGGYLIGYLPAVWIIGRISTGRPRGVVRDVLAMICGSLVLYLCGMAWLHIVTGMPPARVAAIGMLPFLPGDAVKIAAAAAIARSLRPVLNLPLRGKRDFQPAV